MSTPADIAGLLTVVLMFGWGVVIVRAGLQERRVTRVLELGLDAVYKRLDTSEPPGGPGIRAPVPCAYRYALFGRRLCVLELALDESRVVLADGRRVAAPGITSDRWEAETLIGPGLVEVVLDEPVGRWIRRARFVVAVRDVHLLPTNWSE